MMQMNGKQFSRRRIQVNKWDLYWANYEYLYNTEEEVVRRPVIILDGNEVLPIVMEVTKHPPRIDEPGQWDCPIENWRQAGLRLQSTAKVAEINRVRELPPEGWKIGHLSDFDIENLKIMMRTIPENTKSPVHREHPDLNEAYKKMMEEIGRVLKMR